MFDIEKVGKKLQMIMHLEDWKIQFNAISKETMEEIIGEGYAGYCIIEKRKNEAEIFINDESDSNLTEQGRYETLIHELVHIVSYCYIHFVDEYCVFNSKIAEYKEDIEEKMINKFARIFSEIHPLKRILEEE